MFQNPSGGGSLGINFTELKGSQAVFNCHGDWGLDKLIGDGIFVRAALLGCQGILEKLADKAHCQKEGKESD